ncbi:MAG: carbonic anhydrase [Turicibacter sp.]
MKKLLAYLMLSLIVGLNLVGCSSQQKELDEEINITNPENAIVTLKNGNGRFINNESKLINISSTKREQLRNGQNPYAIIIACSDSRVSPTHIFNVGLGEIFEIRLAGNVVDVDVLGSIEYGINHLNIPLIVVMGHEDCGAVTAEYDAINKGEEETGHLVELIDKIQPSVEASSSIEEAIQKNVEVVLKQIENDEVVHKLVQEGKIKVIGAYYHLDGKVDFKE